MSRATSTPESLAREAGTEVDDVLLALWDADLDYIKGALSVVRPPDLARAREACGLENGRELARVEYWLARDGVTREEFALRLDKLGIHLSRNARVLPKGAISRLRRTIPPKTSEPAPVTEPPKVVQADFVWRQIGHIRELRLLEESEIVDIHFALASDFAGSQDPVSPAGVRDSHLLSSAVTRPLTSLGGQRKYQTVELAASALMHSLVHNHAFYNGNKRTALVAVLSMLDRNGLMVTCDQNEIFRWTIRVAQHRVGSRNVRGDRSDIEVAAMAQWIDDHSRLLDRGEKIMSWKFLRRRLAAFGCLVEATGSRGGRVNISRMKDVRERGRLGFERTTSKRLSVQLAYGGDGRDVGRADLKRLRRELHLDDDHGIDSAMFYGTDDTPPDQFIADYRKTLVRLAKL